MAVAQNAKFLLTSKTLWANILGIAGIAYQQYTGDSVLLEPEVQAEILAAVNILLRLITNTGVTLKRAA